MMFLVTVGMLFRKFINCVALNYFLNTGYDYQEITNTLDSAIDNVAYLEDDEKVLSRKYIIALWNCKALRQGHAFDG